MFRQLSVFGASVCCAALLVSLSGCGVIGERVDGDQSAIGGVRLLNETKTSESPAAANQSQQSSAPGKRVTMDDVQDKAEKWFFGPGLGRAMTNVGTSILFPPYAIYLLGNATLSLTGLQPLYMTDLLPDKPRDGVLEVYDAFTSVPGRLTSAVAGRDYPKTQNAH